jgi:hypothetical protein
LRSEVCTSKYRRPGPYKTLSYTWGQDEPGHTIRINHNEIFIRKNLFDAIEEIGRQQQQPDGWCKPGDLWWIDSICIHQKDNDEKSWSVQLLGDIFTCSEVTIAWLGPASDATTLAFEFLDLLGEIRDDREQWLVDRAFEAWYSEEWLQATNHLFERPWWTRAWTLQEYVLPAQLIVVCGEFNSRRNIFEQAAGWLSYLSLRLKSSRWIMRGYEVARKRARIRRMRQLAPEFPFWDVMVYAAGSEATRERDCVYSMLGLTTDNDVWDIVPKYESDDPLPVFQELTRKHVEHTKSLDILGFSGPCIRDHPSSQGPGDSAWPCWVPH